MGIVRAPWVNGRRRQVLFWVNGSGRWRTKRHWARLSGGRGGAGTPTRHTDVILDRHSGTEVVVSLAPRAAVFNFYATDFSGTLRLRGNVSIFGHLNIGAKMSMVGPKTSRIEFK